MGVARLFRWIYERYPLAVTTPGASFVSRIDNLYIDFNALVHESLRRDSYIPLKFTEATLFGEIADYIQALVSIVQPRKRIFIATDGVAPDAKIKQQRTRRYMGTYQRASAATYMERIAGTAKVLSEAESLVSQQIAEGNSDDQSLPPQNINSAISPGTLFMDRLHSFLIAFVAKNVDSEAPGWVQPTVTISGWDMCGEGEHKIIEEIRRIKCLEEQVAADVDYSQKSFSEFFPYHESHCICGLDADIVLLGLGLHLPNIYLLRLWQPPFVTDVVDILESKRHPIDKEFMVIDISCFRECIIAELISNQFHDAKLLYSLCTRSFPKSYMQHLKDCYPRLSEDLNQYNELSKMSLNVLREAFVWSPLGSALITDFIILTLFVGNDFLPEVPGMLIKNNSLDGCIAIYRNLLADTALIDDLCQTVKNMHHSKQTDDVIQPSFLITNNGEIRFDKIKLLYSKISQQTVISSMVDDVIALFNLQIQVEKSDYIHRMDDAWKDTVARECNEVIHYLDIKVPHSDPDKKDIKKAVTSAMRSKSSIFLYYYRKYSQKFNALYSPSIEKTLTEEQINRRPPRIEAVTDIFQDLRCIKTISATESRLKIISSCLFDHEGTGFNIIKIGLIILDIHSNLCEKEQLKSNGSYSDAMELDTLGVLRDVISKIPLLQRLKPYHGLVRSYTRTTVMIIRYYMSSKGNPEWSWFYSYPFSPLISDLALYTASVGSKVSDSFKFSQELADFKSEPLCTSPDISINVYNRLEEIIKTYTGPVFSFLNDRPKTTITQLCSVFPPDILNFFIQKSILTPQLKSFYQVLPRWDNIFILNETSSFESFYFTINLRRTTPYFVERHWFNQSIQYGDGFEKLFSPYYKDYPLGISEFFPLKAIYNYTNDINNLLPKESLNGGSTTIVSDSISNTSQYKALTHMLRSGCAIHIIRHLPDDSLLHKTLTDAIESDNCYLFCQPGQTLGINRSRLAVDYDLFYIPELSTTPQKDYVYNYSPESCNESYISLGVWLSRFRKDLRLISEQPDNEYEIRLNKATIWFTGQKHILKSQFIINHADFFSHIDEPHAYSTHLYISAKGKVVRSPREALSALTIGSSLFPIRYTGLRVYVPTIAESEFSDRSIGFVICNSHAYKSQTLCLYPSLEQPIDKRHFESYYRQQGRFYYSWLNLNVFNEKTHNSIDALPELSSSYEMEFLSTRTGASVTNLICGSPALTYGNSQVGVLYGILIGSSIYLRKSLYGGFVDCTKQFIGTTNDKFFTSLTPRELLTKWFHTYWELNKGIVGNASSFGLAIIAPLNTLTSIDGSPIEMLTIHSELQGGLQVVIDRLHRILFNNEYLPKGTVSKYSSVVPTASLPMIPVALSMFHDCIQRSRILSSLTPLLGLPMTKSAVRDFAAHLSRRTHVHVSAKGANTVITTHYTISESDVLRLLHSHIDEDTPFILSPQRLKEMLEEKNLPLTSVSTRTTEYTLLKDTSITQPHVPLDMLALLCPCVNYLEILESELNVIVTEEYFEFLVSKIDMEGSDKLFRNIGLTIKGSDWYTPGYFVMYEGNLWPTYFTIYTILLYKFAVPFSTRALKYIMEHDGKKSTLLPTSKEISPYYRYLIDDNSTEQFIVNGHAVDPQIRRAAYISDPSRIPVIALDPIFPHKREHSRFPYINGLDHILSNISIYIHGILVPLIYRYQAPLNTPVLPQPFVSLAHKQLAMFSACGKETVSTQHGLTLSRLLQNNAPSHARKITTGSLVLLNNRSISVPGAWAGSGQIGVVLRNDESEILILTSGSTSSTCGFLSETTNLIRISPKYDINKICLMLVKSDSTLNPCMHTFAYLNGSHVLSIFKSRCNVHHRVSFANDIPKHLAFKPLSTTVSPISWCGTSLLEDLFLRYNRNVKLFHCIRTAKRISMTIAITPPEDTKSMPSFTNTPVHISWGPKDYSNNRGTPATPDRNEKSKQSIVLNIPVKEEKIKH